MLTWKLKYVELFCCEFFLNSYLNNPENSFSYIINLKVPCQVVLTINAIHHYQGRKISHHKKSENKVKVGGWMKKLIEKLIAIFHLSWQVLILFSIARGWAYSTNSNSKISMDAFTRRRSSNFFIVDNWNHLKVTRSSVNHLLTWPINRVLLNTSQILDHPPSPLPPPTGYMPIMDCYERNVNNTTLKAQKM